MQAILGAGDSGIVSAEENSIKEVFSSDVSAAVILTQVAD